MSFLDDDAKAAFELRQEFLNSNYPNGNPDDCDEEPLPESAFGSYGRYRLVGHGNVTNDKCGRFSSFYGCGRVELHERARWRGLLGQGFCSPCSS